MSQSTLAAVIGGLVVALIIIGGALYVKNAPPAAPPLDVTAQAESADKNPQAVITTAQGKIVVELYPSRAPKTVANFVKLAQEGFYNGLTFHRVEPGFVVQGGDPLSKTLPPDDPKLGTGGPGYTFEDEINPKAQGVSDEQTKVLEAQGYRYDLALDSLPVTTGALAMANAGPNTNGSQFFIVTGPAQPHLDGRHTVFGKVIEGFEVAQKIAKGDAIETVTITQ